MGSSTSTPRAHCVACMATSLRASELPYETPQGLGRREYASLVHTCGLAREQQDRGVGMNGRQVSAERRMEEGRYYSEDDLQQQQQHQQQQRVNNQAAQEQTDVMCVLWDADEYMATGLESNSNSNSDADSMGPGPASPRVDYAELEEDEEEEEARSEAGERESEPYIDEVVFHADYCESQLPVLRPIDTRGYQKIEGMCTGQEDTEDDDAAETSFRFVSAQDSSVI